MTTDESELRAMTDETPSPPDILTRLREHVLHFIGLCMPETRQLLLDAAAEIDRLRQYRLNMEEAHGERLYHVDHLLEHFNSDGKLNGTGEWRLVSANGLKVENKE